MLKRNSEDPEQNLSTVELYHNKSPTFHYLLKLIDNFLVRTVSAADGRLPHDLCRFQPHDGTSVPRLSSFTFSIKMCIVLILP